MGRGEESFGLIVVHFSVVWPVANHTLICGMKSKISNFFVKRLISDTPLTCPHLGLNIGGARGAVCPWLVPQPPKQGFGLSKSVFFHRLPECLAQQGRVCVPFGLAYTKHKQREDIISGPFRCLWWHWGL